MTVREDEIWKIPITMTLVAGRAVYDRDSDGPPKFHWYLNYGKAAEIEGR